MLYFQAKMLEFSAKNVILTWSEAKMHSINAEKMFKKLFFDSKRSCIFLEILMKQSFNKTFTMTIQLCKLFENVLNRQFHLMSTTQRHIQMIFHAAEHALMKNALLKQWIEVLKNTNHIKQSWWWWNSILYVNRMTTNDQINQIIAEWAKNHEKTVTKVSKQTQKKSH